MKHTQMNLLKLNFLIGWNWEQIESQKMRICWGPIFFWWQFLQWWWLWVNGYISAAELMYDEYIVESVLSVCQSLYKYRLLKISIFHININYSQVTIVVASPNWYTYMPVIIVHVYITEITHSTCINVNRLKSRWIPPTQSTIVSPFWLIVL